VVWVSNLIPICKRNGRGNGPESNDRNWDARRVRPMKILTHAQIRKEHDLPFALIDVATDSPEYIYIFIKIHSIDENTLDQCSPTQKSAWSTDFPFALVDVATDSPECIYIHKNTQHR
jgi:hypothetical protein